ncbi:MAG: carboxypeptidase-like regulatory domain-containing protein [Edaphobacter sp.]
MSKSAQGVTRILNRMKGTHFSLRSFAGKMTLVACLAAACYLALPQLSASAQSRGPVQRTVQGKVVDKSNAPLKGAVVYLKDDHTLSVMSKITDNEGLYRFGQLSQNTDYELWAESNGKKSKTKTISSFESRNAFHFTLKVD